MKTKSHFLHSVAVFLLSAVASVAYGQTERIMFPEEMSVYRMRIRLSMQGIPTLPLLEDEVARKRPTLPDFYPGTVVTITGLSLWGELCYKPESQTFLFQQNGLWRAYRADQLRRFSYAYGRRSHYFVTYDIPQSSGETRTVVLESLTPGASVQLLQLHNDWQWARQNDLPHERGGDWQTQHPQYVGMDGRLITPNAFLKTELDRLLAGAPETVRQWATTLPRPTSPKTLARWLTDFEREMNRAQPHDEAIPTIVFTPDFTH